MFLVFSCSGLCSIHWSQMLRQEWRCSWSSPDKWCSNYIWVINNFIAYWCAPYIRGLTALMKFKLNKRGSTAMNSACLKGSVVRIARHRCNGSSTEAYEWISNFTPHFIIDEITYWYWDQSQSMLVKGTSAHLQIFDFTSSSNYRFCI